jgi:hypothetical protein
MKVIPKIWTKKIICTGDCFGGGGCGASIEITEDDIEFFGDRATFKCSMCMQTTLIPSVPFRPESLRSHSEEDVIATASSQAEAVLKACSTIGEKSSAAFVWVCKRCNRGYSPSSFGGGAQAFQFAMKEAERCCKDAVCSTEGCESVCPKYRTICADCLQEKRLARIVRITISDYRASWEKLYPNQEPHVFIRDEATLLDYIDDEDLENEEVFGSTVLTVKRIDARDILEGVLEDHHEDAWEECDEDALQAALDEWVKTHCHVVSFLKDDETILIDG